MSNFSNLKTKIAAIVSANTYINEVSVYDKPAFSSSPAATVVPSGNASDYATSVDNNRMYAFTVTILVPYDAEGAANAESTLTEIIDSLLDDFDQDFTLSGSCLLMTAAPSEWGWQEREVLYRVATIALRCKVYVNTN